MLCSIYSLVLKRSMTREPGMHLKVDIEHQSLIVYQDQKELCSYLISTAKNGLGEERGSEKTPRGWHIIRAKIGEDCLPNTVFVARRPTGEIYSPELAQTHLNRDWILT